VGEGTCRAGGSASGAALLAAAAVPRSARIAALLFGAVYGVVAVWGFIDGNTVFALLPVNTADNVLHAALAGLGLLAGVASEARAHGGSEGRPHRGPFARPGMR